MAMARVSSFAKRLRALLDEKGLSQAELSRRSGISESSISHYLKGDWEGKPDAIFALAERCGVSEAWLMGYDVPMERSESALLRTAEQARRARDFAALPDDAQERALAAGRAVPLRLLEPVAALEALRLHDSYRRADEHTRQLVDLALRPYAAAEFSIALPPERETEDGFEELEIYEQAAAAGLGNYLELPASRKERYPAGYIPKRTDFGVLIAGDSMEPRIHDASTAFVQSASAIEHGEVGIFVLNGQSYCKQLLLDTERGGARLHSFNPAYRDIVLSEHDELRTLGRVLGSYPP